jgi:hypothetical protein
VISDKGIEADGMTGELALSGLPIRWYTIGAFTARVHRIDLTAEHTGHRYCCHESSRHSIDYNPVQNQSKRSEKLDA